MSHRRPRRAPGRLRALPTPAEAEAPHEPFPPVPDFATAMGLALGLQEEFDHCHACFLLGPGGATEDAWLLTDDHHRPDDALMLCLLGEPERVARKSALVISTGHVLRVGPPPAVDVAGHHRFRWAASWRGVEVVDWIQTDGQLFRSMRLALDPDDTWPSFGPAAA